MSDAVRDNILSAAQWLRILFMAMFAVVSWALGIVLTVLIVLQALFSLVTGKDNENLRELGGALSKYFYQILLFLTYKSDNKPFPFAPFPDTPGAAPLDPVAPDDPLQPDRPPQPHEPRDAGGRRRASTVNTPSPVADADFVSEHEPEVVGTVNTAAQPAPAPRVVDEDADEFAGTGFTEPRAAVSPETPPRTVTPVESLEEPLAASLEESLAASLEESLEDGARNVPPEIQARAAAPDEARGSPPDDEGEPEEIAPAESGGDPARDREGKA